MVLILDQTIHRDLQLQVREQVYSFISFLCYVYHSCQILNSPFCSYLFKLQLIANGHLGQHGEAAQKPADQDKNGLQGKSKPLPQEVGETVRDHHRRQSSVIRAHVLHHHQVSITKEIRIDIV